MNIDTLILSGGSTRGISFLGAIKYLVENNYIDNNFKNIKKIICVSASFIFVLTIILNDFNYTLIEKKMFDFNFKDILNIDDISFRNLFNHYGLIDYNKNHIYIKNLLKEKYNLESISLLKLFKLSNIHIIVKVVNMDTKKIEYIDHINNPKINILKLIQMTSCIPILFKPIKYKNNLYLDGGVCGNCPIEINNSKNYISIELLGDKYNNDNIFNYILNIVNLHEPNLLIRKYDKKNININLSNLNTHFTNFDINIEMKKNLLKEGYEQTKQHFDKYK